jgi:hypothetical protein
MLEVTVNKTGEGMSTTIAIIRIDDEKPKARPNFVSPPDIKTSKLIRRALDLFDAEADEI